MSGALPDSVKQWSYLTGRDVDVSAEIQGVQRTVTGLLCKVDKIWGVDNDGKV